MAHSDRPEAHSERRAPPSSDGGEPEISRSLAPLRDVVASIQAAGDGHLPSANDRRRLVRRVRAAGSAALPALLRALVSARDGEARWAAWLLERVAPAERTRLAERVSRLLEDPRLDGEQRRRADAVLGGLLGPGGVESRSMALFVDELLQSIDDDADLSAAAELIADSVPDPQVAAFLAEVLGHGGERAAPLLDKVIDAGLQSAPTMVQLRRLRDRQEGGLPDPCERTYDPARRTRPRRGSGRPRPRRRSALRPDAGAETLRDRGIRQLGEGDLQAARRSLLGAVAEAPSDTEGLSHLGVCLLRLGDADAALPHLERAAALEPDEALHHWNLAAAAKVGDRMTLGYLALSRYLALPDEHEGAPERRREAHRYLRSCETLIADMHPGVPLDDVLRGERLFQAAFADLTAGRFDQAAARFREVVALLPHHYPSWGNLGAAELGRGNREEARACLARALALKPDYDVARDNLALL